MSDIRTPIDPNVGELQKQLKRAQCDKKRAMNECEELKDVVAALKKWEQEAKTEKDKAARLAKQLEKKQSLVVTVKTDNDFLSTRVEELERQLDEMKNKADVVSTSLTLKVMDVTDKYEVQKSIMKGRELDLLRSSVTRELQEVTLEKEQLARQLSEFEVRQQELENKLSMQDDNHQDTKAELNRQLEHNSELERKLLELQKLVFQFKVLYLEHQNVKEELVERQKQVLTLTEDKNEMYEKAIKMELERDILREKLEAKTKELEVHERKAGGPSCSFREEDVAALQAQINDVEMKQRVLVLENDSSELWRKHTKDKLSKAVVTIDELTQQNDSLLSDNKTLEETLDRAMLKYQSAREKEKESRDLLRKAEVEKRRLLDLVENLKAKATLREEELKAELSQCKRQVVDLQDSLDDQQFLTLMLERTLVEKDEHIKFHADLFHSAREDLSWFKKKCRRATIPGGVRNLLTTGKKHTLHKRFLQKCSAMAKRTDKLQKQSHLIAQLQQQLAQKPPDEMMMQLQKFKFSTRFLKRKLQDKGAINRAYLEKIQKMEDENKTLTDEVRKLRLEVPSQFQQTRYSPLKRPKLQPNRISTATVE